MKKYKLKQMLLPIVAMVAIATIVASCGGGKPKPLDTDTNDSLKSNRVGADSLSIDTTIANTLNCTTTDQCNPNCAIIHRNRHIITETQYETMRGTNVATVFTRAQVNAVLNTCDTTKFLDIYEEGGVTKIRQGSILGSRPMDNGMLSSAFLGALRRLYSGYQFLDIARTTPGNTSAYVFRVRSVNTITGATTIHMWGNFTDTFP